VFPGGVTTAVAVTAGPLQEMVPETVAFTWHGWAKIPEQYPPAMMNISKKKSFFISYRFV
jgi:hypothetical protein